ncbi:hypothetical protein, conserved [Eimeria tenella]|uniref:Uncharacterized protein n=1 Tax=Eimeria tenella TaxID=5802 RepID=H9B9U6_EIMTE|nr:hypothetical protein, conserved [Eimeria tenella]AET50756.1 hypothetical protein [Eimeria tenella]CDJ41865.1 hypothetical protein, conserved [Eimeria tenella]|eukprot:XP_013232615.1 hypothetical protein, conserved [Eimeria tenella]
MTSTWGGPASDGAELSPTVGELDCSFSRSVATEVQPSDATRPSGSVFLSGPRSLHSLRRLKDLEEEDATLGISQGADPATACPAVEAASAPKEEGASESEDDTLEVVRSMKDLQRMRGGPRKGLDVRASLEEAREANEEEEAEDAGGLLEKNFASGGPGSATDKHLEEFLRERLKDKQHESREEKALREHDMVDKMRDLYAIPDHLKVADKTEEYKDQMNWVTGLVEVELPMETKLKNIEATERAKRQLLRKGLLEEAEENPEDPDVVRKTAFGQRYTWYIPDYQFRKRNGQQAQRARDGHEVKQFAKRTKRMHEGRGRVGVAPM